MTAVVQQQQQQPPPTATSITSTATTISNPTSPTRSTHTINTSITNATTTSNPRPRTQSNAPQPLVVRALYDYHSPDSTNLSFQAGQLIRVLTQLQSGWWDGCIDGERGWFPCNFVTEVDSSHLSIQDDFLDPNDSSDEDGVAEEESGDDSLGEQVLESAEDIMAEEYTWIPQADKDGRTFFINTQNGTTSWELPGTRVFLDEWEDKISDDEEDDGHPRSSIDSENSEDILMLGPIQDYVSPDLVSLYITL
jgi:hypothetical protein